MHVRSAKMTYEEPRAGRSGYVNCIIQVHIGQDFANAVLRELFHIKGFGLPFKNNTFRGKLDIEIAYSTACARQNTVFQLFTKTGEIAQHHYSFFGGVFEGLPTL